MIKQEQTQNDPQWLSLRYKDTKWNTFYDPQDLEDPELADVQNITYEKGYPSPRKGSRLAWGVPTSETNDLLCTFAARASDGTNYALLAYAPNFYFRDETNNQWIKINSNYSPSADYKTLMYGYKNWNAGVSSDVLYAGNGKENTIKWRIGFSTIATTTAAADTTLVLSDASKFFNPTKGTVTMTIANPAVASFTAHGLKVGDQIVFTTSGALPTGVTAGTPYYVISAGWTADAFQFSATPTGTGIETTGSQSGTHTLSKYAPIVIKASGGSEITKVYISKSANTLTLTTTVGSIIAAGAGVTFQLQQAPSVSKGKILLTYLGRLITANKDGGECTLNSSVVSDPEDFSAATTATSGFLQVITDGAGGIVGVDNFGEYLLVEKEDSLHKIVLVTATATDGSSYKRIDVLPVASDISLGPVQPWARIKKNNYLYFATATEGIFQTNPDVTGDQTSIKIDVLSQPIKNYVETVSFTNSRTTSFDQKIFWTGSTTQTADTILVYDLLRDAWTKFTGWQVKDWLIHNKKLYFVSSIDNSTYEAFYDTKIDGEVPIEASLTTKAFDFGNGAVPKTAGHIFATGYIHPTETLNFEITLTTGDQIIKLPYQLTGSGHFSITAVPTALAMLMLGVFSLGGFTIDGLTGLFKVYLALPMRYGFYTLQVRVYSSVKGSDWGLTGLGFAPWYEVKHSANMDLGVVSDSTSTGS